MKYSIIMPVYNSMKYIDRSIKSIFNQTYSNWELIIVDDGSNDNSLEICKKFEKIDDRIKVFHQDNFGPGFARNYGITKCIGDYVIFIDSDDYFEKDYLEIVNNRIQNESIDLLFINTINEQANGKINYVEYVSKNKNKSKNELIKMQICGEISWGPCCKVVKTSIVKKFKFSDLKVGEELIFSFNVLNDSENISFIEKPLYHYVHNGNGQHKKGRLRSMETSC